MSLHVRHIQSEDTPRVQIKFLRYDLLYRHKGPVTSRQGATLKLPLRPIDKPDYAVGPTVLDMLTREEVVITDEKGKEIETALWRLRELATLWPEPAKIGAPSVRATKTRPRVKVREVDHPFKPSLASGGRVVEATAPDPDFVRIEKLTTITLSPYAMRLTVGMKGDLNIAYEYISSMAAQAWDKDLERSRALFEKVRAAGADGLLETPDVAALRPDASISQQIEARLMREACVWLGVDPDLDCRRGSGRPRTSGTGDEGQVIAIRIDPQQQLSARVKVDYNGIAADTDLSTLQLIDLVELLGRMRIDRLDHDCDLLEAYLDRVNADWRDAAQEAAANAAGTAANAHDPYEILGVARTATTEDVRRAWKRTMQQVHPDKGIGKVFAQMAADAYRAILKERGEL